MNKLSRKVLRTNAIINIYEILLYSKVQSKNKNDLDESFYISIYEFSQLLNLSIEELCNKLGISSNEFEKIIKISNNTDYRYVNVSEKDKDLELFINLNVEDISILFNVNIDTINKIFEKDEYFTLVLDNLFDNYLKYRDYIDNNLNGWSFDRLGYTEQAILLLALAELALDNDKKVVINEAVELAKQFCDDKAFKLINGVLDK